MTPKSRTAAFTLVELLVGMSLALMVMTAVLSTYVTLGRNFTRTLGISSANQPNLETQARRTNATFAQDVRMASGISGTPSATNLALYEPSANGTKTVSYYINSTAAAVTVTLSGYSTTVPAKTLVRVDGSNGNTRFLQSSLQTSGTNTFNYYDASGNPYTTYVNYLPGIKQLSLTITLQTGSSTNGTLTPAFESDSPRLLIRNKALLQ